MFENLTSRERCLLHAINMIHDRVEFYKNCCGGEVFAYESAATILDYAWNENWECLNQFDYFNEKE